MNPVSPIAIAIALLPLLVACQSEKVSGQDNTSSGPVTLSPGDDIQTAAANAPEGTTFILQPGVFRQQSITPKDGQKFIGSEGTVLSGSMLLANWKRDGSLWVANGLPEPLRRTGICDSGHELCSFREDLFVDDKLHVRVASPSELGPGKWLYQDGSAYLSVDPTGSLVELSVTPDAFSGAAKDVSLENIVVEKYASEAQKGAIDGNDSLGWTLTNVSALWNHGGGLAPGKEMRVIGGSFSHNGQIGVVGEGDGAVLDGVEIAHNNYAYFNFGWEAGGTKFWQSDGLVVRNSCIHNNAGPGLWTDINNINTLYENNVVFDNEGDGIKHEISYKATIRNNFASGNGKFDMNWLWSAQILVQNSSDVEVYGNTVEVPATYGNGISLVNQDRGSGEFGPWVTTGTRVYDNTIIYLGNRGASGLISDFEIEKFVEDTTNVFDKNTYVVRDPDQAFWRDRDGDSNWEQLRRSRMEKDGEIVVDARAPTKPACRF